MSADENGMVWVKPALFLFAVTITVERSLRQKQSPCLGGRLLRFARSDNNHTVIAMERSSRQKQSLCLGGRLLRFASSDNNDGALGATEAISLLERETASPRSQRQ